jgi:hypothetical protein
VPTAIRSNASLKEIQFSFDIAQADAIIVGFYSWSHRGIFTNMESAMHIHFQTSKNDASGHIHALQIGTGAVLSLPRAG